MNIKSVVLFLAGSIVFYLLVIALKFFLFQNNLESFNMHPVYGLLAAPLIVCFSSFVGIFFWKLLSLAFKLNPSPVGIFLYGLWCALPVAISVEREFLLAFLTASPLVPFILGCSRKKI